jgi:hypothetical protein
MSRVKYLININLEEQPMSKILDYLYLGMFELIKSQVKFQLILIYTQETKVMPKMRIYC